MRDESMPICQMRLMAGLSVGKVVGRWALACAAAERPRAVATAARAAVRRRGEDMGGSQWVVGGAGMEDSARWRGRLRASAPLGIMRHTRYGGRACIDGRWECCQGRRWP